MGTLVFYGSYTDRTNDQRQPTRPRLRLQQGPVRVLGGNGKLPPGVPRLRFEGFVLTT
jgi:hypothetical protein